MVEIFSWPGAAMMLGNGILMYFVSEFFRCYLLPRSSSMKERYPFESTVELSRNKDRILEWLCEIFFKRREEVGIKGETVVLNVLLNPPMVFTNSVENITYILKTIEKYTKGGSLKAKLSPLLGQGIFNADGKQWFAHRKTSANLFKLEKFRTTMLDTFNMEMDKVVRIIKAETAGGKAMDMQALMAKMTLESIGRVALGLDLGCLEKDHVPFAHYFDYCTKETNDSFVNPMWRIRRYCTPAGWNMFRYVRRLDNFCYKLIAERRMLLKTDPEAFKGKNDLLNFYLEKGNDDEDKASDTYLEPNDRNLRDVILNIFIAGRDTTANALSWALYRLCIHPDVQSKVREELRPFKEDLAKGAISYKSLQECRYLEAVCMEVLRLYPSVAKEAKNVECDDTLPDGTKVKKGDLVIFAPYVMGRDVTLWGEDCLTFDPQRFVDKPKPSPFVFTAFQAGPRICLGQNFAILEMKCVLARLLSNFEFELAVDKDTVTYDTTLTLPILGELPIKAKSIDLF